MLATIRPYLALIKAVVVGLVIGVGAYLIYNAGADSVRAQWEIERRQVAEQMTALNAQLQTAVDQRDEEARKAKQNAKILNDKLRNAIVSGERRLSIAVSSCKADGTGPGDSETRADIVPAVAGRIIDVGIDGDDAVRDLNECVDKYNAIREQINGAE